MGGWSTNNGVFADYDLPPTSCQTADGISTPLGNRSCNKGSFPMLLNPIKTDASATTLMSSPPGF